MVKTWELPYDVAWLLDVLVLCPRKLGGSWSVWYFHRGPRSLTNSSQPCVFVWLAMTGPMFFIVALYVSKK